MLNVDGRRSSGYQLILKGADRWRIVSPNGFFDGNLNQVIGYSINRLGFEKMELDQALNQMDKNIHNAAVFGHLKRFMWSYDYEESKKGFAYRN